MGSRRAHIRSRFIVSERSRVCLSRPVRHRPCPTFNKIETSVCTHNPKVGGSNPPPATNPKLHNNNDLNNGGAGATVNEYFQLSNNKWTTLASMPKGSMFGASAVYKGQLYCIGGWASFEGKPINNAQIYQPWADESSLAFT